MPFSGHGDLSDPGIEPWSPVLLADFLPSEPLWKSFLIPEKNISKSWLTFFTVYPSVESYACVSCSVVSDSLQPYEL